MENNKLDPRAIMGNPYDYYKALDALGKTEDVDPDDVVIEYNEKNFKEYLDVKLLPEYKDTKSPWLMNAINADPAFMLNPIKDHYAKTFPSNIFNGMSPEEIEELISIVDPITWGQKYLLQKHGGWKPRCSKKGIPYQSMIIRNKSRRLAVRAGRRIGKSAAIAVRLLHKAFTWTPSEGHPVFDIVIFTPSITLINVIFKIFEVFIDNNPLLMSMVVNGKIPTRQNPNYTLQLTNGVTFTGHVSGSTSIRGSRSDILWLDEASYLTENDNQAVLALLTEHPHTDLILTSTPTGLKDYFYERVHDPDFLSLHFPSPTFHPMWTAELEKQLMYDPVRFKFEYLAEFATDGQGVFQRQFIEMSKADYSLEGLQPQAGMIYGLGVDWNDFNNGTKIHVVEYDPVRFKYRLVAAESVAVEGWTQLTAVNKVVELNRKWRPHFVYADEGHGATQQELLHERGLKAAPNHPDRALLKAKAVGFKRKIKIFDPGTRTQVEKETKPFMISNAVRVFENGFIELPREFTSIFKQLEGYRIDRVTPSGMPVYVADSKAGDHDLDALAITLLGFVLEYSELGNPHIPAVIAPMVIGSINGEPDEEYKNYIRREKAKAKEREEVINAGGILGGGQSGHKVFNSRRVPRVAGSPFARHNKFINRGRTF